MQVAQVIGLKASLRMAESAARLFYEHARGVRELVMPPIAACFGGERSSAELDALARACVVNDFRCNVEIEFIHRLLRRGSWQRHVRVVGTERLDACIAAGRGVIAAGADLGNNEVGMTAQGLRSNGRVGVVVNPFQSAVHQRWMAGLVRRRLAALYPSEGALISGARGLREGRLVFIVPTYRDPKGRGARVTFLGQEGAFFPAVGMLAARTGCPVAVVTSRRLPGDYQFEVGVRDWIEPPTTPSKKWAQACTSRVLSVLDAAIRESPAQFAWYRAPRPAAEMPSVSNR